MAGDYSLKSLYPTPNLYQPKYVTNQNFNPSEKIPHYIGSNLISAKQMGVTVNPMVANQLGELSKALNQGTVPVEVGALQWDLWETIPQEHFHEMRRKAELAGSQLSVHAPVQGMDPSGFGERGWDEQQREIVERQLSDVVDKTAILSEGKNKDPVPITIHGSNSHGSTWTYKDVDGKRQKVYETLVAVDKSTGQAAPMKESTQIVPHIGENGKVIEQIMTPEEALESQNSTMWRKEIDKVLYEKETADKILSSTPAGIEQLYHITAQKPDAFYELNPNHKELVSNIQTAHAHLKDSTLALNGVFDKAYQYAEDDPEKDIYGNPIQNRKTKQQKQEELQRIAKRYEENLSKAQSLKDQSIAVQSIAQELRNFNPNMFTTVEKFSTEKASETFSNLALHGYTQHKDKAPIISIENLDQGRMGFSQGEDLKNLVIESRKKFVDKATKQGMSQAEAKKAADKLIGVTFDVGHLNISRKYGFNEEDMKKEAEAVAKYVKHVHLTDNFGYADSHLPIGMGNVPVKELLEALGEEGKKARKINEVGGWFKLSEKSPYAHLLEAAGSPLYSSSTGPYWSETTGFQQSYHSGYGNMLPQTHYESFGSGFSRLPTELGGTMGGGSGGRMGGGY